MALTPKSKLHWRASRSCADKQELVLIGRLQEARLQQHGTAAHLQIPLLVSIYTLQALLCREASVAVHDKGDVLWHRALAQYGDDELPEHIIQPHAQRKH